MKRELDLKTANDYFFHNHTLKEIYNGPSLLKIHAINPIIFEHTSLLNKQFYDRKKRFY